MRVMSVAEAKAHLSELLDCVQAGSEVVITRRGVPIARVSGLNGPKKPIDFDALDELRARQPLARTSSVRLIRRMREQRY